MASTTACRKELGYDFLHCLWPSISEQQFLNTKKQYSRLLDKVKFEIQAIGENIDIHALETPEDILLVVKRLRQLDVVTKSEAFKAVLIKALPPPYTEEQLLRTLRCAINIWLTVGIGPRIRDTGKPFAWDSGDTLRDRITSHFENSVKGVEPSSLVEQQLQEELTAASLCSHYGFSIYWTHDLSEHLTIDWKHKVLTVYEDKILACNHMRAGTASLPVPDQLFEETIDSLNLLFPFQNDATKKLLEKQGINFYGLGLCGRPRKLLLNDYRYWRGRISNIRQIFQTPPIGIQQLLLDDDGKNLMSTFTFWITVAAALVALLAIGLAIASLVYSIKQYELGWKQYELSVVQACGDSYVRSKMPMLCSGHRN